MSRRRCRTICGRALIGALSVTPFVLPAASLRAQAANSRRTVAADSVELRALRAVIARSLRNPVDSMCLDPNVAAEPTAPERAARERWPEPALREMLSNARVAIDTSAGAAPRGARACARSRTVSRRAFARPMISGDTGTVAELRTQLDARERPDSFRFVFLLERRAGNWTVDPRFESETTHIDVNGAGCYRFSHPLFAAWDSTYRIDTVVVRADSVPGGVSWRGFPAFRLSPGPDRVGMGHGRARSHWSVAHDTLNLDWSIYDALMMQASLHVRGDSLRGEMRLLTDAVGSSPPTVQVTGVRIRCPQS